MQEKNGYTDEVGEHTVIVPPKHVWWFIKLLRALHLTKEEGIYAAIILFLVIGSLLTQASRQKQGVPARAGTNTARISLQPQTGVMPPDTIVQIWETAQNPVAFTSIKIIFDPAHVKLTGEILTGTSPLTQILKQTPMSEANTTGIINLSLGLDPAKRATPATGTFQLATIALTTNTATKNLSTLLHLDPDGMQVINPDLSLFTVTTVDSTLILNPMPTATPMPMHPDTTPPVVTIASPTDGSAVPAKGNLSIQVDASDESSISNITVALDGVTGKICTKSRSCSMSITASKLSAGVHKITATAADNSVNKNTASTTISVTK